MKKTCSVLSTLLLVVLLIVALCFVVPMLLGYKEMTVLSGSMEPNIHVGSVVCVNPKASISDLQPGDVVTYRIDSSTFVTHRLVSIDPTSQTFVTKGDANQDEDGSIPFSQFYGKASFNIPYLGYISTGIRKPAGIMAVTCLVVVIILLNTLPAMLSKDPQEEKAKQEERHQ